MKSHNERKLQRQHARMGMESGGNHPAKAPPPKMSLRTGLPTGNLSNRDVASKRRSDDKAIMTRRSKKLVVTLPSLGDWGKS